MNWQIGKARCRSDEYEAEILATDMGVDYPILGRIRTRDDSRWMAAEWNKDGRCLTPAGGHYDLIPPRLSLEEAAAECVRAYYDSGRSVPSVAAMLSALQHFVKLQEEGRV